MSHVNTAVMNRNQRELAKGDQQPVLDVVRKVRKSSVEAPQNNLNFNTSGYDELTKQMLILDSTIALLKTELDALDTSMVRVNSDLNAILHWLLQNGLFNPWFHYAAYHLTSLTKIQTGIVINKTLMWLDHITVIRKINFLLQSLKPTLVTMLIFPQFYCDVSVKQHQYARAEQMEDPQENLLTCSIIRHDFHEGNYGSDNTGNNTRFPGWQMSIVAAAPTTLLHDRSTQCIPANSHLVQQCELRDNSRMMSKDPEHSCWWPYLTEVTTVPRVTHKGCQYKGRTGSRTDQLRNRRTATSPYGGHVLLRNSGSIIPTSLSLDSTADAVRTYTSAWDCDVAAATTEQRKYLAIISTEYRKGILNQATKVEVTEPCADAKAVQFNLHIDQYGSRRSRMRSWVGNSKELGRERRKSASAIPYALSVCATSAGIVAKPGVLRGPKRVQKMGNDIPEAPHIVFSHFQFGGDFGGFTEGVAIFILFDLSTRSICRTGGRGKDADYSLSVLDGTTAAMNTNFMGPAGRVGMKICSGPLNGRVASGLRGVKHQSEAKGRSFLPREIDSPYYKGHQLS
ncbi:hypothetical protein PR048_008740 [Dryococelus australis]|uniref:Uncharacterized protein n=1 Tax=Dryococelus australis TaxID=614101 RepID=A0ABQ9HXY2_9NEOP|nr:hypothetical protein PR048_008740 [Dryococelus australis]